MLIEMEPFPIPEKRLETQTFLSIWWIISSEYIGKFPWPTRHSEECNNDYKIIFKNNLVINNKTLRELYRFCFWAVVI